MKRSIQFTSIPAALTAAIVTFSSQLHADTLEYVFYDKEGIAGTEIIEQTGTKVSGELKLGWNNRRLNLTENFTIGKGKCPANCISRASAPSAHRLMKSSP
ncbi:hypothetical protein [Microbulbifer taiwanensis]|uniref:hypothetical protein n=1 Tax=Microbulbifer taiwanensis TaxID=986746 RepID=UPI00361F17E6